MFFSWYDNTNTYIQNIKRDNEAQNGGKNKYLFDASSKLLLKKENRFLYKKMETMV